MADVGTEKVRELIAGPSSHLLKTYWVAPPVCGVNPTLHDEPGVQLKACGLRYEPGWQPLPVTVNGIPAVELAIVTETGANTKLAVTAWGEVICTEVLALLGAVT